MASDNRTRRLERRLERLQRRLRHLRFWDSAWTEHFRRMLDEVLAADPDASDTEVARAIAQRLDAKIELPGVWDTVLDIGVTAVAWLVLTVMRRREAWLRRRIARVEQLLARGGRATPGAAPHAMRASLVVSDHRELVAPTEPEADLLDLMVSFAEDTNTDPDVSLEVSVMAAAGLLATPPPFVDRLAEGRNALRAREEAGGGKLSKGWRPAAQVSGVVLHQMSFSRGDELRRYDAVTTHFVIAPDGGMSQIHPFTEGLNAANGLNNSTVSVEFVGNLPSAHGKYYKPAVFGRHRLSEAQVRAGRALLHYLKEAYGLDRVYGHIQAKGRNRGNDPGPDIWSSVGEWAIERLGFVDVRDVVLGEGLPIPPRWRGWPRLIP